MNEPIKSRLTTYREIAYALARQPMSHQQRNKQLTVLWRMVETENKRLGLCTYRQRLDAICAVILYIRMDEMLTHTDVKAALWLIASLCQQAINDAERWFSSDVLVKSADVEPVTDPDIPF